MTLCTVTEFVGKKTLGVSHPDPEQPFSDCYIVFPLPSRQMARLRPAAEVTHNGRGGFTNNVGFRRGRDIKWQTIRVN